MVAPRELLALREQLVEMSAPTRGVFPGAQASGPGCVENSLDPASDPRRRLGLDRPDRFKASENVVGANVVKTKVTNRSCILAKGHSPLRAMLYIAEPALDSRDEFVGETAKRVPRSPFFLSGGLPRLHRVNARTDKLARIGGGLSGIRQRDVGQPPKAHLRSLSLVME